MLQGAYRLIEKTNVAVTRPALDAAGWRCQGRPGWSKCADDEGLRVIELRGAIRVVCESCRAQLGSPAVWSPRS
jgi:hypothetical protein